MAPHASFGVHEYEVSDNGRMNVSVEVAKKLEALQRGGQAAPRMRKISYVPRGAGSCGNGGGAPRIADLVVLNEYDEEGNLAKRGTCIVKGVQRKFAAIHSSHNPMTTNKDGSEIKVEMQYQIVSADAAKPRRPWSAPRREQKQPLEVHPDDVLQPSEFPNKTAAVNAPPTRTRPDATSWMETRREGSVLSTQRQALRANSMLSINFPVAASLYNSIKNNLDASAVDLESAAKAHSAFQERDSFKERENIPMSQRRALARQPPARSRVRHNPTVGATERAVPRVDKTSPPASPRALKTRSSSQHVRFEPSDVMRLESRLSDADDGCHEAHAEPTFGMPPDDRVVYSPCPRPVHSPASHSVRPSSAPAPRAAAPKVPPLSSGLFLSSVGGCGGGGGGRRADVAGEDRVCFFGAAHVSAANCAPASRPPLHPHRIASAGRARGGCESGGEGVRTVTRATSAPASDARTAAGASAGGAALSARASEAEKVSVMLRHINAAHSKKMISDQVWSSAISDLESKTNTQLELMNRVVYVKKEDGAGPTYERPTCSTSLKLRLGATTRCF